MSKRNKSRQFQKINSAESNKFDKCVSINMYLPNLDKNKLNKNVGILLIRFRFNNYN